MPGEINILENPVIGNIRQWILVRGKNKENPVLLLLQAGPGLPMISEADTFERRLKLEEYFTVVYWDQRGCGKTFSKTIPTESMNLQQMVSDTSELSEYLIRKFNKDKIYIAGFSIGGTAALISASKDPQKYYAAVLIGPDIIMEEAERFAYDFALSEAKIRNNRKALVQLQKIGRPPNTSLKNFQTRVKWIANFGGVHTGETYSSIFIKTIKNMFACSYYSLADILRTIKGISFTQKYLLPGLVSLNLFNMIKSIDTKICFIHGIKDAASPERLAKEYFDYILAPAGKFYNTFNISAHMPHFEEPEKFRSLMIRIQD
jgi:pimeloyl-ACP methyl ester carboxylesterase